MEDIEKEIAAYEARTGITLDAHQKGVLREMIRKDNKFWEKEAADYIPGYDDGEAERQITSYEE